MALQYPLGATDPPPTTHDSASSDRLTRVSEMFADGTAEWRDRIEAVIERYPWPTLLLALAVGYVLARRMR